MMTIRPAQLADCERIAALAQGQISRWQRWDAQGRVEDVPYSALSIYDRWLHGGAWMSLETAAIHLGRLLLGTGMVWLAEDEGEVVGYAEAYAGSETEPFGSHLHLGQMLVQEGRETAVADALVDTLRERAAQSKCGRLLTTPAAGAAAFEAFERRGAKSIAQARRYSLAARTGQGLYQAVADTTTDARQITGWSMPLGRRSSARQMWEMMWQPTWDVLPQLADRTRRLRFSASGQDAYVVFQRGLYDTRTVDVMCWTARGLSSGLLMALRDWTHREGFRTLTLLASADAEKALGTDAEADGYSQDVYSLTI